jgi:endo-1,3-1,4-beta-glycanase ExoK
MHRLGLTSLCLVGALLVPRIASATKSAELYTVASHGYGRFETRVRFAAGDGVVSAYFLWKEGSEMPDTFWNELDYEKIGANCDLHTNALYGNPGSNHTKDPNVTADLCGAFHVYAYEWTADYIAWFFDGTEVRRETGEAATAFAENATAGMRVHFNVWPGDASFGGNFNPSILPVHQYIDWVQFSAYANGAFTLAWREDFDAATVPTGWATGDWGSPKNLSTHDPLNVNFLNSCAVLSLTADDATGPTGSTSDTVGCTPGMGGSGGAGGSGAGGDAGTAGAAAGASPGGAAGTGGAGTGGGTSAGGTGAGGTTGGAGGTVATTGGVGGSGGVTPPAAGAAGSGAGNPAGGSGAGVPGTAGVTSAGGTGGSQVGTTGGAGATAGSPTDEGEDADSAEGCGCRVPGSSGSSQREPGVGAALLFALALASGLRRRASSRVH